MNISFKYMEIRFIEDISYNCLFVVFFFTPVQSFLHPCLSNSISQTSILSVANMSLVMSKPDFYICENTDADQLRGNREADQRLCFRYTDSTIPLLPKSEISSLFPSSVVLQPGLCRTWSETPKTGFLTTRLISGR